MKETKPFTISKHLVLEAFQLVKANAGAAGVDQQSLANFEANLKDNLYKLWSRLSSGSYFPPPVKAVPIPKKTGGERILGVPTVSDRIAQMVIKIMFEPMVEPHFHPDSYGYRPNKSALDAINITRERCWKYERTKGAPQGGVISPLLSNLFLHYVFDVWMSRNNPTTPSQ